MLKCRFRIGRVVMEDSVVASVLIKNTLSVTMVVHVDTDAVLCGFSRRRKKGHDLSRPRLLIDLKSTSSEE
ncbi:hypothetical protein G5714_020624 [Onychostoma macrolepis]|uniref:Uncharacterized protein n=1 Tax=Onychostoma macrolepis TaxID=369639 RepID=A0A7J6BUT0_9TELE|nr:hypothetical protein G5714_020624 [Onychostoma macrolepis]